jgi:hypothetical protein
MVCEMLCDMAPVLVRHDRPSSLELFRSIYRGKHWGGADRDFYSGSGSYTPTVIEPYVAVVRAYLASFPVPPVVVDIGCGDFTAADRLTDLVQSYHGCDVVPELIERNQRLFAAPHVTFSALDAVTDRLPRGEVVIVKQVLQHLTNNEIAAIVRKLGQYAVWIITEHLPGDSFEPNLDMPTSGYTRLGMNSGVVLTETPFRIAPKSTEVLCEVHERGGVVRTVVYRF